MKQIKVLNGDGYKMRVFNGVIFPVIVEAKISTSGIDKGFALVTYAEFSKHGLKVPEWMIGFEREREHSFMFSRDQWEELTQ